jgi:putative membrane protein
MKQWLTVAAFACLVGTAAFVSAQTGATPGGQGGSGTGSKPSGAAAQGQSKPGAAGDTAKSGPAAADAMFIRTAAMDGMAEVEHGRLAAQNATHDEVKQFGQRMVDDHGKAGDELKTLASQKNVTLPTELDAKHKAMQDKLAKMKGDAFDRAYMAHMVTAHQQAVALFTKESTSGKDADAKAWAGKTLPTLQEHLKMAKSANAKVAGGSKPPAEKEKK